MIDAHWVFLGGALSLVATAQYIWQTLRGDLVPNRVTWFMWAVAPIIGFFAQLDDGVGLPAVGTLAVGLGPVAIFVASFYARAGYWRLTPFDFACGAVSLVALMLWLTLDDPAVAIVFAVLADFMGAVPTIRKSWTDPATEAPGVFALSGLNGVITTLTLTRWNIAVSLFPIYLIAVCFGITAVIVARTRALRGRTAVVAS